jgi:hypothetical protein
MKMFLIGLAVAAVAFIAWNFIPGFRYAAPHHLLSAVDKWTVPVNPRFALLPCQDDVHAVTSWRIHSDGLCHAEDASGLAGPQLYAPPQPQPHNVPVTNGALTIGASAFSWYPFTIPPGATSANIAGRFTATGGTGNDIIVYILDEDGFVNFKNGHPVNTYYNSGKVTQASIAAVLPNTPGTYYLLFDNRYSILTPKAVTVNATLNYMQ